MAIRQEKEWNKLYNRIKERGAQESGLYEAIRNYYTLYEDDLIAWLAGLYDKNTG